jgi:hypothetical protein
MISAATAPKTLAMATFENAALSPPAAKNMPHATNAAGTTRWKLEGSARPLPRSPSVTQWKLKFSATST